MESLKNLIERSEKIILAIEFILTYLENPKNNKHIFYCRSNKKYQNFNKRGTKKLEELDTQSIFLLMSYSESLREIQNPSLGEYRLLKRIKNFLEDIPHIKLIVHDGQLHWQYCYRSIKKTSLINEDISFNPEDTILISTRDAALANTYAVVLTSMKDRIKSLDITKSPETNKEKTQKFKEQLNREFQKMKLQLIAESNCLEFLFLQFGNDIQPIEIGEIKDYIQISATQDYYEDGPIKITKRVLAKYNNPNPYEKIAFKVPYTPEDIINLAKALISLEILIPYLNESDLNGIWQLLTPSIYIGEKLIIPTHIISTIERYWHQQTPTPTK